MMVLTAVMFGFMALFVRLASETVPVGMIVCTRYALSTAFMLALTLAGTAKLRPVNYKLLFCRAFSASMGAIFYFFAIASITLSEAVILKYSFPLFAVIISALAFGEHTNRRVIFLIAWSFAGVIIMMNPSSFIMKTGYLWGILQAVSAGAAVAFVRKLRATDDSWTIMFFTSVVGLAVSLPLLMLGVAAPHGFDAVYLLLAAVLGISAQFTLVFGMRFIKTGAASVIMMIEVVVASMLGILFLGHIPSPHQIVGGAIILIGGALLITSQGKRVSE